MSFFLRKTDPSRKVHLKKNSKNLKTTDGRKNDHASLKRKHKRLNDEEIESDSDDDRGFVKKDEALSCDEEDVETVQEKKLRLTKEYLSQLAEEERKDEESKDIDRDVVSHRLRDDVLEQSGKLLKNVAHEYTAPNEESLFVLRGHKLAVTCLVVSPDCEHIFSGSKDCSIIKWNVSSRKKVRVIHGGRKGTQEKHKGHTDHILDMAISSNNKFLATGGRDKLIHIWNPSSCELLRTFRGHKGPITGLAFRQGSNLLLFSASHDRAVKLWNLDEMAYMETLYGHQDPITSIDSMTRERAITSGGGDRSIRIWKVVEESQLVFMGHKGNIDCVKLVNEEFFLSGSDDGSLALWTLGKKRPLVVVRNAHNESGGAANEHWISSIATLPSTDLVASGSRDSCIRFWHAENNCRSLKPLFTVPVVGFINAMQFSSDGSFLVAGVGQEHKLGRWWRLKEAKNSLVIIPLKKPNPTKVTNPKTL